MQQYLDAQKHVPKKHSEDWQIAKLGKHIDRAFGDRGNKIVRFVLRDSKTRSPIRTFLYTPVTQRLRKMGERLGEHLHAMINFRPPEDEWWSKIRVFLEEVYRELDTANLGTLIGVPLLDHGKKVITTNIEFLSDDDSEAVRRLLREGTNYTVQVDYLDELPREKEANSRD